MSTLGAALRRAVQMAGLSGGRSVWLGIAVAACLLPGAAAQADLTVSVGNAIVDPGKTGFVDVFVRSNSPGTDIVDAFSVELRITPLSGSGLLQFTNPPLDSQLGSSSYLFYGDSLLAGFPPAGSILSDARPNDTYLGGDATLSGLGVSVPGTDTLLARIEITAIAGLDPFSQFTITPVAGPFTTFNGPLPNLNPISYSTQSATVIINPEPSSLAVWCLLLGLALARVRGRSR